MAECIKLYGEKEELFNEIHDEIEDQYGYRPSKPEVVGVLMAAFDDDTPFPYE
jgi:hypothetical protein